jgi:hypothetical protein
MITFNEKRFKVVEDLGFQNGVYAKVIIINKKEIVVTRSPTSPTWKLAKMEILPGGTNGN